MRGTNNNQELNKYELRPKRHTVKYENGRDDFLKSTTITPMSSDDKRLWESNEYYLGREDYLKSTEGPEGDPMLLKYYEGREDYLESVDDKVCYHYYDGRDDRLMVNDIYTGKLYYREEAYNDTTT